MQCSYEGSSLSSSRAAKRSTKKVAAARVFDRFRGGDGATGTNVPLFGINSLLYVFFSMEAFWVPHISIPFGGSVVLLCGR